QDLHRPRRLPRYEPPGIPRGVRGCGRSWGSAPGRSGRRSWTFWLRPATMRRPWPTGTRRCWPADAAASVGRLHVTQLDVDALQLGVVFDGRVAVLAADAGLLVAAERHFDRRHVVVVDPAGAGLKPGHHPVRPGDVAGDHAGRQPEFGVVGARDH